MDEESLVRKRNKAQKEGNLKALKDVQKKLGDLYYDRKHYDDALEAYRGQLQASECSNDNHNMANAHRMIGEVLAYLGNFKDALKHINLYLQKAQYLKDLIEEQRAYATLGRTYLMETESYDKESEKAKKEEVLKNAKKALSKSIKLCDQLENRIDRDELMQMRARLLLNLGLVLEHQKKMDQSLMFIEQAASMCKKYKLSEDLHRTNLALASHYDKLGNSVLALKYMDDAAKVDDSFLKADAKFSKAELLMKLGEWAEARKMLYFLYKTKLSESLTLQVTGLLKKAVLLYRTEDKLLLEDNLSEKLKLYETMGDAAVSVRALDKAIEYYKYMLECAEKTNSSRLAAAVTSLAQTLKDVGKFEEAVPYALRELELCNDPKDSCNSALFTANLLVGAKSPDNQIRNMFNRAIALAKDAGDGSLEKLVVRDFVEYLKSMSDVDLTEIASLNERLENLPESQSEYGDDVAEEESPDVAADIDLEDLSDLEDELGPARPKFNPKNIARTLKFKPKKNDKGETPLHVACIKGNVKNVEKLLEENHPTQVYDNCGWSPLHEASNHGFVDIVRLLIRAGANVNDPGGSLCEGVTPLHDAAANGHAGVVQLLLDSGANPDLLTGQGDRALDCLEQWRSTVGELSTSELREYALVRKKLKEKTTVRCQNKNRRQGSSGKLHALVAEGEENTIDERLLSITKYVTTSKPEKISAGEDYKRTIANLQHPGRMQLPEKAPAQPKITAPLIDSEEMLIDDEWLEDDLGIFSRGKEKDKAPYGDNGLPPVSTAGAKRKVDKNDSFERKADKNTKRPKVYSSTNERASATTSVYVVNENSNDSITSECMVDPPRQVERWPKSNKPRQTNLLKQGFVKQSETRTPPPAPSKSPEVTYMPPTDPQPSHSQEPSGEPIYLEVQVDRETFDLKLHTPDLSKTLKFIEEMISNKFESKAGLKPSLRLKNMDDNVLDSETVINTIKTGGNKLKLRGEITHIELPPIVDRYKKVCSSIYIEPSNAMLRSLRSSDNTSNFRLNANEFSDDELEPLVKCLHYQKNLQVLNLSRVTFYYWGDLLNYALSQLSNLCELHLQCCDIGPDCLSLIEKLPSTLRVLDLSYNPLGSKSLNKLYKLLEPLERLQTLSLRSCELTDFPNRYFNQSLVDLDISWNPIGGQGAANLLQRHLMSLSISNTQVNVVDKIFVDKTLGFSLLNLEFLELSGVGVTDLDVDNISMKLPCLLRINLSNNINVTSDSLQLLLARNPTMTDIDLSGCSLIDCPPSRSVKMINHRVCTVLAHMSLDVIDAWESLWEGKSYTKKLPSSLVLIKPV